MSDSLAYAMEAEQAVIGALLRFNDSIDDIGELMPQHFYRADHRVIFREVLHQIQEKQRCDVVTVGLALADLPDIMPYLNALTQAMPSAATIGRHAELVCDRALRRALMAAMDELTGLVHAAGPSTAAELLDLAQGKLASLAETRSEAEPVRVCDAMIPYIAKFDERTDGVSAGMGTSFLDLDALLCGGPRDGKLVILAARPSMGKTAFALNIATHVAEGGQPVAVFSMEMENEDLLDREIAQIGRIPLGDVIQGQLSEVDWRRFAEANTTLANLPMFLDDTPALSLRQLRSRARRLKRKHGLKLIVVDYLQLMSGDGDPKKNRNQQIEEISRGLKALAKELKCVVLALSQLNRNGDKARPQLSDLRDSGAIEQDADVVIFLHREEVQNPHSPQRGFADLFVAKNRQGKVDDVLLEYQGMYTLFVGTNRPRPKEQDTPRPQPGGIKHYRENQ